MVSGAACTDCGGPVGRKNQTGFCRSCMLAKGGLNWIRSRDPEAFDRKRREGMLKKYRDDPEFKAKTRANLLRIAKLPHAVAARTENCRKLGLSRVAVDAMPAGSEARKKQAKAISERKLAWCPPELRAEYMHLLKSKRIKAAEAKPIILEMHEANLRRLRAKMGVTGPVEVREVNYFIERRNGGAEPGTYLAAERQKAEKARVDALRQRRTLCPICGARSDIGCEHGVAA